MVPTPSKPLYSGVMAAAIGEQVKGMDTSAVGPAVKWAC